MMGSWWRWLGEKVTRSKRCGGLRGAVRLCVERLESRCVPAKLGTPLNDADDTIAEAINVGSITARRSVRRSASLGFPTDVGMYRFTVGPVPSVKPSFKFAVAARTRVCISFTVAVTNYSCNNNGRVPNQPAKFCP